MIRVEALNIATQARVSALTSDETPALDAAFDQLRRAMPSNVRFPLMASGRCMHEKSREYYSASEIVHAF